MVKNKKGFGNLIRNGTCCVVGCINRYCKPIKDVHFYKFPLDSGGSSGIRRQKWITNVNRVNEDGSEWIPTFTTKICSEHFVAGKKSEDPKNPSYIPTIFQNTTEITKHCTKWKRKSHPIAKTKHKSLKLSEIKTDLPTLVQKPCTAPLQNLQDIKQHISDKPSESLSENARKKREDEIEPDLFEPEQFSSLPAKRSKKDNKINIKNVDTQHVEESGERNKNVEDKIKIFIHTPDDYSVSESNTPPVQVVTINEDKNIQEEKKKARFLSRSYNKLLDSTTSTFEAICKKLEKTNEKYTNMGEKKYYNKRDPFLSARAKCEKIENVVRDMGEELFQSEIQATLTNSNYETESWKEINFLRIDNLHLKKDVAELSLKVLNLEKELRNKRKPPTSCNSGFQQGIQATQILLNADGSPTILCVTHDN